MNVLSIIKYLFTFLGLAMLAGTLYINEDTRSFLAKATKTEGTVVQLVLSYSNHSRTYHPVVRFTERNGQTIEFVSSIGSNPPGYSEGEKVEVLYLPAEPYKARLNSFFSLWGASIIVGALGGIFLLIGCGFFLAPKLQNRKKEYLLQQGSPIETEFQSVGFNTAVSINGRNPFQIITQWKNPSTSQIHIFKSDNLWYDPTEYIQNKRIRVFIDRNNPKKYYVDLSFLPKIAE